MNPALPQAIVVNDDPIQLEMLTELTRQAGLQPLPFSSAEEALASMSPEAPPALVITDVNMPGIDGWRFCRLLRSAAHAAFNQVPILVISATFSGDSPDRIAAEIGADAFLAAPVELHRFATQVEAILRGESKSLPLRVLIVDDCDMLGSLLRHAFSAEGYRVDTALTLQEATAAFAQGTFDLAVIDYHLPDGHGDSLLEQIRAGHPDCSCIMMTGDLEPALSVAWMKMGAAAYVHKPFHPDYLLELCAKARREQSLMRLPALIEKKNAEHKRANEQLAENQEILSLLMHYSPIYTYIKDVSATQSRVLVASENFQQMVGVPGSQMANKTMEELFPPEFAAKISADDWAVVSNGKVLKLDEELNGKSYITIKFPIIRDGRTLLAGYTIDVTERRLAESALRQRESYLSAIIENQPGLVWLKDAESRFLMVNKTFAATCGLETPEQVVGKTDLDIWPQEVAEKYRADDHRTMHSAAPFTDEESIPVQGQIRWFETFKKSVFDDKGNPIGTTGYSRDITERKQAEEELSKRESLFRSITENAFDMISLLDMNGCYTYCNPSYTHSLGYKFDELRGRSALDLLHPDDRSDIQKALQDTREGKVDSYHFETRVLHKDGSFKWVNHRASVLLDANRTPMQILVMGTDVTAHKLEEEQKEKLEAQLLQAQKMESIGRLAGGVAHDFNNMLGVIMGHAELALENTPPSQPIHSDLQEIRKAAERSAGLTKQLLAFARKQTAAPKILHLNETVEGMLQMIQRLIGEQIELKWNPGADIGPVKMDPSQIDQILVNLCVNARDAIGSGGRIQIETRNQVFDETACTGHVGIRPGEYVRLSVRDTGCGMDAETIAQIFEPFFTTKGLGKGTGLGLATVYGIVKQNHGMIDVQSTPGQGTTFHVYLPRHGLVSSSQPESAAPSSHKPSAETILLVEDEPAILTMTKNMLQRQGYTVLAAGSSGEAIRLAQDHAGRIDLLVTDVVMPEMNGRDLARTLHSLCPNIKRLFMSGHTADVLANHGMLDAGVHFIQKPFTRKLLMDKILDALEIQHPA